MGEPLGVAISKVGRFRYEVRSFNTQHKDVDWHFTLGGARRVARRRLRAAYPRTLIERWGPNGRYADYILPEEIGGANLSQPPVAMIKENPSAYQDAATDCMCRGRIDRWGRCKHVRAGFNAAEG